MGNGTSTASNLGPATILTPDVHALEIALLHLLCTARDHPVKLLKAGGVSRRNVQRLKDSVPLPPHPPGFEDEVVLEWLVLLAVSAGLLNRDGLDTSLDLRACDRFFGLEPDSRLAVLRDAWLSSTDIQEFLTLSHLRVSRSRLEDVTGRRDCVPGAQAHRRARALLVQRLGECTASRWQRVAPFLAEIQAARADFLLPREEFPPSLLPHYAGIRLHSGKDDLVRSGNWHQVEGALLWRMLQLPMFLLGWIALGEVSPLPEDVMPGADYAFKLLAETDAEPTTVSESSQPLMVQANYEITALVPEMSLSTLWKLARMANLKSYGQVATFVIDERRIAEALHAGTSLDELVTFLESHSRTGLPSSLKYQMVEWTRRTERLTIYTDAYLFEAEGIDNLEKLISESYQKRSELREITSVHRVGSASACPDPVEGVPARARVFDYSRTLPPTMNISGSGEISIDNTDLHFRLSRMLERLAEPAGLDRWKLSHERVQEARQRGLSSDQLLELLRQLTRHELPSLLRARLLAWSGRSGSGRVGSSTTLTLSSADMVRLLRQSPEVQHLLGRPLNANSFEIAEDHLQQVIDLLQELGIQDDPALFPVADGAGDAEPDQLARVVRAPMSGPIQGFASARFRNLWETNRDDAMEYATKCGIPLSVAMRTSHGYTTSREVIEPRMLVRLESGALLEAVRRSDLTELLIHTDQIVEANPA